MTNFLQLINVIKWAICLLIAFFMDAPEWAKVIFGFLLIYNVILFIFVTRNR